MTKSRALIRLLVLCLCVARRMALDDETRSRSNGEKSSSLASPITGHNWKYPREHRLAVMHSSLSSPIRRPFHDQDVDVESEHENDVTSSSGSGSIEQQLNLHEAQLARLHGLGPAEIAALYNWQQRTRLPPMFGRNPAAMAEFAVKRSHDSSAQRDPLTAPSDLEAPTNDTQQTAAWPKRSSEMKKPDKSQRNGAHSQRAKEKATDANKAGNKAGKNPRRQQQQQQQQQESVQHFEASSNNKGKEHEHGRPPPPDVSRINRNLATQFLLRSPRENRQYDVPIIECPPAEDGMERFACPTPDIVGRYRCIDDHVLCDGFIDCPGGEDEDGQACMFYKTMKAHLDLVADALLRWVRGR